MDTKNDTKRLSAKWVWFFIIFMMTIGFTGCQSHKISGDPVELKETKKLTFSVSCGYNKNVKRGRYLHVNAEISNTGENFSGYFSIIVPEENGSNVSYQKGISIFNGKTENVTMDIPADTKKNNWTFFLHNQNNKVIFEKQIKVSIEGNPDILYLGVLSDDYNSLSYLNTKDTKTFKLSEETFSENYRGLDTLDGIIVNDYNSGKLNNKQYNALKEFVNKGKTLVLGTGENGSKTLELFQDDFLSYKTGSLTEKKIKFGKDTILKKVLPMDIADSKLINERENENLIKLVQVGNGNILVAGYDLSSQYHLSGTADAPIVSVIKDNLSETARLQIETERDKNGLDYNLLSGLSIVDRKNRPNIMNYGIILFIYIILIGPILYIVLKKKDKRNLTWFFVPVISLMFSVIIYIMGSGTRIQKPFSAYLNFITLSKENMATREEFFSVTAPNNRKYGFDIDSKYNIAAINSNQETGFKGKTDNNGYKTLIQYGDDKTTVERKDSAAFTPVYFKSESKTKTEGNYKCKLQYKNGRVSGVFANRLGYEIENAVILLNNTLILVGNMQDGTAVNVAKKKSMGFSSLNSLYNSDVISEIVGGDIYNRNTEGSTLRKSFALQHYITNKLSYGKYNGVLLGFSESYKNKSLIREVGYENTGISLICIPLQIDDTENGTTFIPNMDSYITSIEGNYDESFRTISSKAVKIEYKFPAGDKIRSIIYSKESNEEFDKNRWFGFYGTIEAYNYKAKQYDVIFSSGKERQLTSLDDYLDGNHTMRLLYEADEAAMRTYNVTLPVLSATKEAVR